MKKSKIYLSPPFTGEEENLAVREVLKSGWLAPAGPLLSQFEVALSERFGFANVLAVNSGTSALHLAVKRCGISPGDKVLISTFTFVAAANAILYEGGVPVFVDSEVDTWNIDPVLIEGYLKANSDVRAVLITHIFGRPARINQIRQICKKYEVPLIEDAAESLGAKVGERYTGSFGDFGICSFNGNKLISTGGGGALICANAEDREKARFWSEQSKENVAFYEHREVGYNYRMSSVAAAIGVQQLKKVDDFIQRKKFIYKRYKESLMDLDVFVFPDMSEGFESNCWLTTLMLNDEWLSRLPPAQIVAQLAEQGIETRRFWKPLHLQPLFEGCEYVGGRIAENLFTSGICLPSGVGLTEAQQDRVIYAIKDLVKC